MPITINGTTGLAGVDGSATTPAVQGTDTNTGEFFPAADTIAWTTGGTERMRVDSSGNVGIGTSSPNKRLHVQNGSSGASNYSVPGLAIESSTNVDLQMMGSTTGQLGITFSDSGNNQAGFIYYQNNGDYMQFATNGSERARIDSSGNLLVGNSTASQTMDGLFVRGKVASTGNQWNFLVYTQSGSFTLGCRDDYYLRSPAVYDRTSGGAANVFVDSSGYLYRSTSSIRYKRDVVSYDKGLETVSALRPVYYKSNVESPDGAVLDEQYAGFIAEEVAAAGLEEFVVRNDQGQPDALHYGNMVSLLTKAIQELTAKLDAAEARIAALEGAAA